MVYLCVNVLRNITEISLQSNTTPAITMFLKNVQSIAKDNKFSVNAVDV